MPISRQQHVHGVASELRKTAGVKARDLALGKVAYYERAVDLECVELWRAIHNCIVAMDERVLSGRFEAV